MQKGGMTFIYIVGLCLIVGILGEMLFYLDITQFSGITQTSAGIGRLGGLILILSHGTLKNDKPFFHLILIFLCVTIIGAMIKIMHLPGANLIILTGFITLPVIYFIHFFKKHDKHHLDILKAIWVGIFCMAAIFLILHFPYALVLKRIEGLLFLILFADFAYVQYRKSSLGADAN
ncbi:MAG TPA: hypothetical protein VI731_12470 [Bacteroidia bacterium]|nr:hypothetical protein [Bacteroidia bacterium]